MNSDDLNLIKQIVADSVKQTVNGKVDRLIERFDEHLKQHEADRLEIKELLQARASIAYIWKSLVGLGSAAAAWIAIKTVIKP